ncbi:class I SAM-dependent methyltransferase [Chitinivorax sp. B]|uniref:class I SAM-dependent methyltransferase n=1 Tax=Chitinivorax sp. B TaxID=2502235 RepID=UPI0010F98573|nr:class I SAM-dependent methyltransferase [Chitinivorax sp. B]
MDQNAPQYLSPEVDWATIQLPDAWPDQLNFHNPLTWLQLVAHTFRRRQKVAIPADLPGAEVIPKYVLLEFHNMPNGNYSNRLSHGYLTGFDLSMLNLVQPVRHWVAGQLSGCQSVLDLGCAGGKTAAAIHRQGVPEVHGLDPSPYLLRHAACTFPEIKVRQGVMERLPYPDARFDGMSAVFVFHEVPPSYIRQALAEIARVLKPGGLLVLAEPSPIQLRQSALALWRCYGWRGVYFRLLAHRVFEPFVESWHQFDLKQEAALHGLQMEEAIEGMPIRRWVLRRVDS